MQSEKISTIEKSVMLFEGNFTAVNHEASALLGEKNLLFVQKLQSLLCISTNVREGKHWVYNTYEQWEAIFVQWSRNTVYRVIKKLEGLGIVESSSKFNKWRTDRTKWYTINYEALSKFMGEMAEEFKAKQAAKEERLKKKELATNCSNPSPQNGEADLPKLVESTSTQNGEHNNQYNTSNKTTDTTSSTALPVEPFKTSSLKKGKEKIKNLLNISFLKKEKKEVATANEILKSIQNKNNPTKSPSLLWKKLYSAKYGCFYGSFTSADLGKLSQIKKKLGTGYEETLETVINNWVDFAEYVKGVEGLYTVPSQAHVGFTLKHCNLALAWVAKLAKEAQQVEDIVKPVAVTHESAPKTAETEKVEQTPEAMDISDFDAYLAEIGLK